MGRERRGGSTPGSSVESPPDEALPEGEADAPEASSDLRLRVPAGVAVTLDNVHVSADAPAVLTAESATGPIVSVPTAGAALASAVAVDEHGQVVDAMTSAAGCPVPPAGEGRVLVVPDAYASIQEAIDDAVYGDTVRVEPGTYQEHLRLRSGVKLVGAGATRTILDGQGLGENLIDYTGAQNAVVQGFTLGNVGQTDVCPDKVLGCSGNHYAAAVYADGHYGDNFEECARPSLLLSHNVIQGNDVGVMLYFHALAMIRNNIFVGNTHAFVANHLNDHSVVAYNVFYANDAHAVIADAATLDVLNNVIVGSGVALEQEHVQRGRVRCNVLFANTATGNVIVPGEDGNIVADPLLLDPDALDFHVESGSPALTAGCWGEDGAEPVAAGAHGGPLGIW
ncbi:NosD domain-containing protein [Sorangium sp. So ce375]|uniref:NosD domain-containing protein n=1 Tax=Sorangium sp. So ce375 TaxID=3133306 RepID=UPI003F5B8F39